jgi:hypothetical protein
MFEMYEERPSTNSPKFLPYILRFVLMWTMAVVAVLGFSRFFNTLMRKGIMFELDFPAYLPTYLIVSGLIMLIAGMAAYIAAREKRSWHILALWVATLLTIANSWLQRLVLWSPDQAAGNNVFIGIVHLIWLFLISVYSYLSHKAEVGDGSGN